MSWLLQIGLLQNIGVQDAYSFHPKDDTSKLISLKKIHCFTSRREHRLKGMTSVIWMETNKGRF